MIELSRNAGPRASSSSLTSSPPRYIFFAGIYSSGSTWLFNFVRLLIKSTYPNKNVISIAVDSSDKFPDNSLESESICLVKTHCPELSLLTLLETTGSPVLLCTRDPRDAVSSLIARFEIDRGDAISLVTKSCLRTTKLVELCEPMTLRYENGYINDKICCREIAHFLGISVDERDIESICSGLSQQSVVNLIKDLEEKGTFDLERGPINEWDQETLWHPRHIGNGEVGKFHQFLTEEENWKVINRCRGFMECFGYNRIKERELLRSPARVDFKDGCSGVIYLGDGFDSTEIWGTWSTDYAAFLEFPLSTKVSKYIQLQLLVRFAPGWTDGEQVCEIFAHHHLIGRFEHGLEEEKVALSFWLDHEWVVGCSVLTVQFLFRNLRSPRQLGINDDGRMLGIGLIGAYLSFE